MEMLAALLKFCLILMSSIVQSSLNKTSFILLAMNYSKNMSTGFVALCKKRWKKIIPHSSSPSSAVLSNDFLV